MGPTSDGPCNVAAFIVATTPDDQMVSHVVDTNDVAGDIDIVPFLPTDWDGKFVARLYPIEQLIGDMQRRSDLFANPNDPLAKYTEEGVTHLALLEGKALPAVPCEFWFGRNKVRGVSLILLYAAERETYRLIHCQGCCNAYLAWIGEMQGEWGNADGPKVGAYTLN